MAAPPGPAALCIFRESIHLRISSSHAGLISTCIVSIAGLSGGLTVTFGQVKLHTKMLRPVLQRSASISFPTPWSPHLHPLIVGHYIESAGFPYVHSLLNILLNFVIQRCYPSFFKVLVSWCLRGLCSLLYVGRINLHAFTRATDMKHCHRSRGLHELASCTASPPKHEVFYTVPKFARTLGIRLGQKTCCKLQLKLKQNTII